MYNPDPRPNVSFFRVDNVANTKRPSHRDSFLLQAFITVFSPTFKLLAISLYVIPNKRNSIIFLDNLWYNGVRCKGWIMILAVISDMVRIGCNRVRHIFKKGAGQIPAPPRILDFERLNV